MQYPYAHNDDIHPFKPPKIIHLGWGEGGLEVKRLDAKAAAEREEAYMKSLIAAGKRAA